MNSLISKISMTMLTVAALSTSVLAAEGTVNAGGTLRLREESNTESTVLANIPNGTVVDVAGVTEDGWFQVTHGSNTGYVSGEYLIVDSADLSSLAKIMDPIYGHVVSGPLNVRAGASTSHDVVGILNRGTVVEIANSLDGWYQTEDGFLSSEYVEIVDKAEAVELKAEMNKAKQVASTSSLSAQIVNYAKGFLGSRYVYGGTTPSGFDCSGFVGYVYKNFGITLNRSSRDQYSNGVSVSKSNLQAGDVVFFASGSSINHVGLYIGNNQFIHASTPSTGVIISDLNSSYYTSTYVGARRMI